MDHLRVIIDAKFISDVILSNFSDIDLYFEGKKGREEGKISKFSMFLRLN